MSINPANPETQPITSTPTLIAEPETISPETTPPQSPHVRKSSHPSTSPKLHGTSIAERHSGRTPPAATAGPSKRSHPSADGNASIAPSASAASQSRLSHTEPCFDEPQNHHSARIISQVADWLHGEKSKRAIRRRSRAKDHGKAPRSAEHTRPLGESLSSKDGRDSIGDPVDVSDSELALDELEQILYSALKFNERGPMITAEDQSWPQRPRHKPLRRTSKLLSRKKSASAASDSDVRDEDLLVPSAEVTLDNSRISRSFGGEDMPRMDLISSQGRNTDEDEAWADFKTDVVRLTHTLRIAGWRRVAIGQGPEIQVSRLSGALTNAVYVVSPPKVLHQASVSRSDSNTQPMFKKSPRKLLLRIYGPQAEHLIDRENELQILRRLARRQIGPTLLGTFSNGRFEEFFEARTLTAQDIRDPETSKQIAKRMRELHDGIELLGDERNAGAFVWSNWDKWKGRCEEVVSWLDAQMLAAAGAPAGFKTDRWKTRGLVCGVEWPVFRRSVEAYRSWLERRCGGLEQVKSRLVFAHNDTQYGNLLRLEPSGESPLLLPQNSHKQLQVIDFEYASANVPGLEFANHFTEWCYDYHRMPSPYLLHEKNYPTMEEQRRFLRAYVQHNPGAQARSRATSTTVPSSSAPAFLLDSRAPPSQYADEEREREAGLEAQIHLLHHETRLWRVANSAQWVAWGIVQAKVPGMGEGIRTSRGEPTTNKVRGESPVNGRLDSDFLPSGIADVIEGDQDKGAESSGMPVEEVGDAEEHFDYLGYAQERALLFWGDVLQLGLVRSQELPAGLLKRMKTIQN